MSGDERPIDEALYWAWVQQRAGELEEEFTALLPDGYSAHFDTTPVVNG